MNLEGVIKFRVEQLPGIACREGDIVDLEVWRTKLRALGLLGRDPARYDGLGFGNLSKRMPDGTVLITASQTGHLEALMPADYARIEGFDPAGNFVRARGPRKPSSETLSHLAVYLSQPAAHYVFHAHCPEIWNARERLGIRTTCPAAECGTPEMFHAIRRLAADWDDPQKNVLAMGGHVDGLLVWGQTAQEAGDTLLLLLNATAAV